MTPEQLAAIKERFKEYLRLGLTLGQSDIYALIAEVERTTDLRECFAELVLERQMLRFEIAHLKQSAARGGRIFPLEGEGV